MCVWRFKCKRRRVIDCECVNVAVMRRLEGRDYNIRREHCQLDSSRDQDEKWVGTTRKE